MSTEWTPAQVRQHKRRKYPGSSHSDAIKAGIAARKAAGRNVGSPPKPVDVERVRQMRADGRSWRKIAAEVGCSVNVARRAGRGL